MEEYYFVNISKDESEHFVLKKVVVLVNEHPMEMWVLIPYPKIIEEDILIN